MLVGVGVLKTQVGVRVDGVVWEGYKRVCVGERLRPNEPVDGFLRVVVEDGSALNVLKLLHGAAGVRAECFEDYVRVLLGWYTGGRRWISTGDGSNAVDALLLFALKEVADGQLRKAVQAALVEVHAEDARKEAERGRLMDKKEAAGEKEFSVASDGPSVPERTEGSGNHAEGKKFTEEQLKEFSKQLEEIRKRLGRRNGKAGLSGSVAKVLKEFGSNGAV